MQQTDFKRFKSVIVGMGKLYEREVDGPLLDAYWLALRDWSLQDFEAAATQLMSTAKFMPRPAEFNELRKAGRPVPAEAWSEARALAKTWRPNMPAPRSGNPLIDRAVESIGGYRAIAMCNTDALGFTEKRFIDAFESMQDADDVREAVPQIAYSGARALSGPRSIRDLLPGPEGAA